MRLLLSILTLLVLCPAPGAAGCPPDKMFKITFHDAAPGYGAGHFATQPKTLYRFGSHHARLEQAPDPANGVHGLVVVNRRDTWMVNLAVKGGRHIVDSSDRFEFHAPIVGSRDSPFAGFEFGRELAYMEGRGIGPAGVTVEGLGLQLYEETLEGTTVRLMVDPVTGLPWGVDVVREGRTVYRLRYDEYRCGLEPDMTLFDRPAGIEYETDE